MEGAGPLLAGLGCEEVWLGWTGGQVLGQQETLQLVTSLHTGVQECRTLAINKLQTLKYMPLINDVCRSCGWAAGWSWTCPAWRATRARAAAAW